MTISAICNVNYKTLFIISLNKILSPCTAAVPTSWIISKNVCHTVWSYYAQFDGHKIIICVDHCLTGNHYKWDWPKSQFCMLNILATIDWLRNLKVANIYFFNILQNTLKIFSFSKLEIRKLENLIFPSSAEPCRILQNSALVPQNSAEHFGEKLRNSADFCRILQNSAE